MKTISVINLKGGVGKSVSVINIAYILCVIYGLRVLIVDNDKQANITDFFGWKRDDGLARTGEILTDSMDIRKLVASYTTNTKNLFIVPSGLRLINHIQELSQDESRPQHTRFKEQFSKIDDMFDYCIIDNPPDFNLSVINALVASDDVIVPVRADKFTFDGLEEINRQIENVRAVNENICFKGSFLTMFQKNNINKQAANWLKNHSGYPSFETAIRNCVKVNEMTFIKKALPEYAPKCTATFDYLALVEEYLQK